MNRAFLGDFHQHVSLFFSSVFCVGDSHIDLIGHARLGATLSAVFKDLSVRQATCTVSRDHCFRSANIRRAVSIHAPRAARSNSCGLTPAPVPPTSAHLPEGDASRPRSSGDICCPDPSAFTVLGTVDKGEPCRPFISKLVCGRSSQSAKRRASLSVFTEDINSGPAHPFNGALNGVGRHFFSASDMHTPDQRSWFRPGGGVELRGMTPKLFATKGKRDSR